MGHRISPWRTVNVITRGYIDPSQCRMSMNVARKSPVVSHHFPHRSARCWVPPPVQESTWTQGATLRRHRRSLCRKLEISSGNLRGHPLENRHGNGNWPVSRWFTYQKWCFSIALLDSQRVISGNCPCQQHFQQQNWTPHGSATWRCKSMPPNGS